jgi:hypothetical protein
MKLAIMQPYFFPYIGYWQLIYAVDRFVIYDDVNFIKKGWINRNRILINGEPGYITIPLVGASQNKRICDIEMQTSAHWRNKMLKSIEFNYRKSPFFDEIFGEINRLISNPATNLAQFLAQSLEDIATLLGISTEFVRSSRDYGNSSLRGQDRILDICDREGATSYINAPGGQALYDTASFANANIDLCFSSGRISPYPQRAGEFVPNLSIIDALMEVGVSGVCERLREFDLSAADSGSAATRAGRQ